MQPEGNPVCLADSGPGESTRFRLAGHRHFGRLVEEAVQRGGHQAWGDCVMILATTALRISEWPDCKWATWTSFVGLLALRRQTYPGRVGLVTKETKVRRRRQVPIIEPLRATRERLTVVSDASLSDELVSRCGSGTRQQRPR
jgi:hypothetical protein